MTPHADPTPTDPPVVDSPAFKLDAPARYAELRARGPVHRMRFSSGLWGWVVVDHELAREALNHPDLRKDPTEVAEKLAASGTTLYTPGSGVTGNMLTSDPPHHTRLRKLVAGAFTARRTQELAPRIREIAETLLADMAPRGHVDLVEAYTAPLPMTVISELLGVPEERRADFRRFSNLMLGNPEGHRREGGENLRRYLADLVAEKRRHPTDDLLSSLITIRDEDDGRLSEAELVGTAVLLVVAGHETTVNLLGNAVVALLAHPDQARLLRQSPDLIPGAVEEFLRYEAPVELTPLRFAAREVRLGGQVIEPGALVVVALGSASRDIPLEGGQAPDQLDVSRPAPRHLAFGHGLHYCLGAPLARLEGAIGLEVLLTGLPDLALAADDSTVEWLPSGIMRGPRTLPVRFTPTTPTPSPRRG